jgi:S-adenosylmethionine hydrolase
MTSNMRIVTLTTDFGVQSQGVGLMEVIIIQVCPEARVVHLMHGLPPFSIMTAARTLETVDCLEPAIHVCVCDPGVGTTRRGLAVATRYGHILIGPDNGVLRPAARRLGGIAACFEITNPAVMRPSVSPIFHGRDVFAPCAAHIAGGFPIEQVGSQLAETDLVTAPYAEAVIRDNRCEANVIQINHFGSAHLNIGHGVWESWRVPIGADVYVSRHGNVSIRVRHGAVFADVDKNEDVILKDDYGRVELATNQGRFCDRHGVRVGDTITIERTRLLDPDGTTARGAQ